MDSLKQAIEGYKAELMSKAPAEVLTLFQQCMADLKATGIENRALNTGDLMPDFELPDQHGNLHHLSDYLNHLRSCSISIAVAGAPTAIWK